ncbi:sec-independent translocase [Streptosporangium sp. NBC_01755]|uniref:sec-independent translocase n=1 Tax=unclassified Streptosporangium TaxID=2632669 RepID=UPI002DDC14E5|nr:MULTISPECIES: sec-independent translocase [unclassified Streptosporangium]WSA26249.1 sec-independent translocase [Streptosporangium sp. NBC_01810]WSD02323.1 sec-independent translocase [Streptosporangium sp. NBC_01755]
MFGLGWPEIVALVVIALLVFGPEKLPQAAAQAGKTLRNLRRMANNARDDLRSGLGPEFADFDPADLNPKNFVRKHLTADLEDDWNATSATATAEPVPSYPAGGELGYGEIPPYDSEAT